MKLPSFCLFLFILFAIPTEAQEKWNLKRCVDYAVGNNISVKQADLQSCFSQLQLQQNKLSQLPNATIQQDSIPQSKYFILIHQINK